MARSKAAARPDYDREIDVRELNCPMPALRARLALSRMRSGEVLLIRSTDRDSPRDFRIFAEKTGHELLAEYASNREFVFYLRKA